MGKASAHGDFPALDHVRLAEELADARLLQSISTELISEGNAAGLYEKIVAAAQAVMHSDYAAMQRLSDDGGELELLASRGFHENSAGEWCLVRREACSACAKALRENRRVIVTNIASSPELASDDILRAFLRMGILATQSTPLISRSGKQVGMLSTQWRTPHAPSERNLRLLDIVARQAADLIERQQAEDALREADRRKNEFLAMLSHELLNPLAPLRNCAQILRHAGTDRSVIESVAGVLERQIALIVRLVDDLLDVSRIGRGKIELRREWTDLGAIVCQSVEVVRPACEAKRLHLSVDVPERPLRLYADPTRLIQAITNLLGNACKFTPPGGDVRVRAEAIAGEARVHVADDGIGIEAEHLPRIFELFAQVDRSTGRNHGGLGIGLTLVKTFVEMHGGKVSVHSAGAGRGAEFTIALPLDPTPS